MKILQLPLVCLLFSAHSIFAQTTGTPQYASIAFIKSKSADFVAREREQWLPVHKQMIKDGKKVAWLLYRVKYPAGTNTGYDYVRFNVFADWKQTETTETSINEAIKKTHPKMDITSLTQRTVQASELMWEQLFQVIDEAVVAKEPSRFIVVNQVKTVAGSEGEYVKMERTYFKPFHAERVNRGVMNNWSFYKTTFPYGSKFEYDYVTLNGFMTWEDITKNPPSGTWQKVHGNLNFDEIHTSILSKRITVNNELWELVAYAID